MTDKEAIKNLKKLKSFHNGSYGTAIDMAIKTLEQQPSKDCVSRESVLMELGKYLCGVSFDEKGIDEVIKELPSVTPQQVRWIPVSEKNPDNRGYYLVSTTDCITIMEFVDGWISQNIGLCNNYVKAWMPLPEGYKEESE